MAKSAQETVNISAPIPASLARKLQKVAKFESRPKTYYIRLALQELLDEKLQDMEDYIEAKKIYDEMKATGEKGIPYEEVFKRHLKK